MNKYAQVVVNAPLLTTQPHEGEPAAAESRRELAFTYTIPEHLAATINLGQLVWVPFGKRRLQGVIIAFSETSPVEATRDIAEIAELRPFLSATQIDLAHWIARTYLCALNDVIQMLLPSGIVQEPQVHLALAPGGTRPALPAKQFALVEWLAREGESELRDVPRELHGAIDALVKRGIVIRETVVPQARVKPKRVKSVRLISATAPAELNAKAQRIVEFLQRENKPVWISAVYAETHSTLADLRKLETAGILALEEEEVWRDSLAGREFETAVPPTLTPEQQAAWDEIVSSFKFQDPSSTNNLATRKPETFLLHGVTGSGKTEIYLRALAEVIARGKQGIILVPEISLTPQTLQRFGARFQRLAVIHSRLSPGERYDAWRRCRDGLVDVVIGARSALFAPLPNLGLIVLDEEHDPSYKQDIAPHYHARAVVGELARRVGATVILGSATPDVETYYRATRGELRLLELPHRVSAHADKIQKSEITSQKSAAVYLELPPVEVVDLRAELKAGNRSMFSRALQREMARTLAAREQVILFLNRRGTATFILCRDCGHVFKCKRCENPMTFHDVGDQLVCHHCNRRDRVPTQCPACGGARIRYFGVGTEKVEAEIQTLFPQARTLRWDWDVTRGKDAHAAILEKFTLRQADILIGTQMLAKGLDLPFVTLVGVISADTSLNLPDFRVGERTFQLLTQVAGRAGRSALGGKAIVQTYNPAHYAIGAAAAHAYAAFYEQEIAFRRAQMYPPFSRLIRLTYTHASATKAQAEVVRLAEVLQTRIAQRGLPALDLLGPAPAFFARVRGQYRYHLIVRGENPHALVAELAFPLGWRVDVDPASVL